jgi:hypothetical protein
MSEFGTEMTWKVALTASTKYETTKRVFLTPAHIHAFTMLHTAAASTVMKLILSVFLHTNITTYLTCESQLYAYMCCEYYSGSTC